MHTSWRLSHVNGIYLLLAQLLERGVFYPRELSPDLVYGTFYQPLAFAPYALLPGDGLAKVPAMRILCGFDAALCLLLLAAVAARLGLARAACWRPSVWALCTIPVGFCLLAMRDDPRATWLGLLAVLAHLRRGHWSIVVAALCLSLAFFTKLTAPLVPCVAIALDLAFRRDHAAAIRFLFATAAAIAIPFAILQWGFGCELLDNGIRLALLEPAFQPRGVFQTTWRCLRDVIAWNEHALGLLPLALLSLGLLVVRIRRWRLDLADWLASAAFVKAWLAYRNPGADYNHLFDLALFCALHAAVRLAGWLSPGRALAALLVLLALDRPWEELIGPSDLPLADAPAARVARALASLPSVPTLVEDPLIQIEANTRPLVVDGGVVFARLRRDRLVRAQWFGPLSDPHALRRIVLLLDPFENTPERPGPYWYGVVNYDRDFHTELVAHWHVVMKTDAATILERLP